MLKIFRNIIPKSSFTRNVLTLMSGTTIAQAIPLAISPILTRIYSPEDFGVLALFNTICVIFGVIINGRYEMAIMLPKHQKDAGVLLKISFLIAIIISLFSFLVIVFFHDNIMAWLEEDSLSIWLYLCPLVFLMLGFYNALNYYHSRQKKFKVIAKSSVYKSLGLSFGQLLFSYIKNGAFGLISGKVFSLIIAPLYLFQKTNLSFKSFFKIDFKKIKQLAIEYKGFPLYSVPSALLNTGSMEMPIVVLAKYFSSSVTGYFSLAHKSISLPMSMISKSFGQVLFQRVSDLKSQGKDFSIEIFSVYKKLVLIGCLPLSIIFVYGDLIFSFVFSEEWIESGIYASYLSPWLFMVFITSPLSLLMSVFDKLKQSLIYNILIFFSRAVVLLLGVFYFKDVSVTVILFSIVGFIFNYLLSQYILLQSKINLISSNLFFVLVSTSSFGIVYYSRILFL